jgi:glucose/arabinose dehydrogenase
VADPSSATVILTIPQPEANHNGGLVQFGPDGYLYIGIGDGGGAGDRHGTIGNGQELASLLGKLLRIDVNRSPYAIPTSNPFKDRAGARPEIWAFGLRNPWRWSFDRRTGDLYIADVGQDKYEEIDLQPASSRGGENYGWRLMEGKHCFNPSSGCEQTGLTMPVAEYDHSKGCSVTGGYVYRGARYPWLDGLYFFADYCSGIVWTLDRNPSGAWEMVERARVSFQPSSFGQDQAGELYLVGHNDGTVYHLVSTTP